MNRLARYIFTEVAAATAFALAALVALFAFFDLLREIGRIGKRGYTFPDAVIYVGLSTPGHIYELLPLAVLIGGILALATLADHSELTVMRTASVSLRKLLLWLVSIGLIFTALTFFVGEYLAPVASKAASRHIAKAKSALLIGDFQSGVWIKDGRQVINVGAMLPDLSIQKIRVYEFKPDMRIERIIDSERGTYSVAGGWLLEGVTETQMQDNGVRRVLVEKKAEMPWLSKLNPDMLAVLMIKPDEMSIAALNRYIEHLESNKQDAQRYVLARWSKYFSPFTCVAMMVIALPFALGSRRSGGVGIKIFTGIVLGLGYWFLNRIMGFLGDLYNLPGWLVVAMPSLLLFTGAFVAVWKKEKS